MRDLPHGPQQLKHILGALIWGAEPTTLVGRAHHLAQARRLLLDPEVRLLTLVGPPGVGKTRLASALVDSVSDAFTNGVHRIDFACAEHPPTLTAALASSIGTLADDARLEELVAASGDQELLLVLDHVEHQPTAALEVAQLLKASASLKIVVSGRRRLQLQWEHVLRVDPLESPVDVSDAVGVAASPAVQLYLHRARAEDATFDLTAENCASIGELCKRLDGLPLAIELAAMRVRVMQPATLLNQLEHRLDILVGGPGDLPLRQRSMRSALDGCTAGLSSEERLLFARLSVLGDGWTVEAARALDGDSSAGELRIPQHVIVGRLESLVDRSLIYHMPGADGQARFGMLETLRAYAHECLQTAGEFETTRARWVAYYEQFVRRHCDALRGSGRATALANLDAEYVNITRVLGACIQADSVAALHLACSLSMYWSARGNLEQARTWLDAVLRIRCVDDPSNSQVLSGVLLGAADTAASVGDYARANAFLQRGFDAASVVNATANMLAAVIGLGRISQQHVDVENALRDVTGALAKARDLSDPLLIAEAHHTLGDLCIQQGQYALAQAHLEQSLETWYSLGDELRAASVLESIAVLTYRQGDAARSLRFLGSVNTICGRLGVGSVARPAHLRQRVQETLDLARQTLGKELAEQAEEAGRTLRVDTAIGHEHYSEPNALPVMPTIGGDGGRSLPQSAVLESLTPRERDVAMLVLRGMSNRQIGAELGISERTAETHVCRILGKLDLESRAQMPALILEDSASASAGGDEVSTAAAARLA